MYLVLNRLFAKLYIIVIFESFISMQDFIFMYTFLEFFLSLSSPFSHRSKRIILTIFVIILGIILIAMVAAPMAVWDKVSRKSCEELIDDEQEYAPFAFDPSQGEGGREGDPRPH